MIFLSKGSFRVGDGLKTRFWEDICLGDRSLAEQYPSLFAIVHRKNVTVGQVLANNPLNIEFRRNLSGNRWNRWLHLVQRLINVNLSESTDSFVWKLTTSGEFAVKSMYEDLLDNSTRFPRRYLWKT